MPAVAANLVPPFIASIKEIKSNEVVLSLVELCDKHVEVCYGCNGPLRVNGVSLPAPYNLVAICKLRREYFKDGMQHYSAPGNVYFHILNENPFVSPFECIQRRMITFRVEI